MATKTTTKSTTTKDTKSVEVKEQKLEETKVSKLSTKQDDEIAKLQAQIELLMKTQMGASSTPKTKKKMVKIVSLVNGGLTLQGSRAIRISKQFDSITVTDAEARLIISNMPESTRSGLFYITDKDFIEENELEDAYETILSDEQLKELLTKNVDEVLNIYNNVSDKQKEIINSMIIDGRLNGVRIDANLLQELGEVSGINFMEIDKIEEV